MRPRISGRDILPILLTGLILAGALLVASRVFAVYDVGAAMAMGIGFMLALAGLQGRADTLTFRAAVIGWIRLSVIAAVVLLASGRLIATGMPLRFGAFLLASFGSSLLLFVLRTRRR